MIINKEREQERIHYVFIQPLHNLIVNKKKLIIIEQLNMHIERRTSVDI